VRHLPQLPFVAAGAPCMEVSGATGVEGRGKQGSMGEWRGRAPPVRAAGASTSIAVGTGSMR
jgi:hypothetical protein